MKAQELFKDCIFRIKKIQGESYIIQFINKGKFAYKNRVKIQQNLNKKKKWKCKDSYQTTILNTHGNKL